MSVADIQTAGAPPGAARIHARSPLIASALEAMAAELGAGYRRARTLPARGHR